MESSKEIFFFFRLVWPEGGKMWPGGDMNQIVRQKSPGRRRSAVAGARSIAKLHQFQTPSRNPDDTPCTPPELVFDDPTAAMTTEKKDKLEGESF